MEENKITFADLMDGNKHPLYFVNGSTCKMYMVEIIDNVKVSSRYYTPQQGKRCIQLKLFDKNGKNRVWGWDEEKNYWLETKHKHNSFYLGMYDSSSYKSYDIYTTKEDAYKRCISKLIDKKKEINKKILKVQESFGLIESKKRYNIELEIKCNG
jgi:hypothetical protein